MKLAAMLILATLAGFVQTQASNDSMVYDLYGPPERAMTAAQIAAWGDHGWGAHEALLHGVPSGYDWHLGARPGHWSNLSAAVTPWGQIYEILTYSDANADARTHADAYPMFRGYLARRGDHQRSADSVPIDANQRKAAPPCCAFSFSPCASAF